MKPISHRSFSGFTLLELLVVTAIISLLMALITPSFARAKERGRQLKCASNLRNIGMATLIYIDDNNGRYFPLHSWSDSPPPNTYMILSYLKPYISGEYDVFHCPSATQSTSGANTQWSFQTQTPAPLDGQIRYTDYKINDNTALTQDPVVGPPATGGPVVRFKDHGWVVVALDLDYAPPPQWQRHSGGNNLLFLDGHVEWKAAQNYEAGYATAVDPHGETPFYNWGVQASWQ